MKKLIILQTVAPDYRKNLFVFLRNNLKQNFELYSGDFYFENSVKTDFSLDFLNKVKNIFLFKNNFLFQTGKIWKQVLKDNVIVMEMNPRIISNWIILLTRRIVFRKTVLWGHAWPRGGKSSRSDILRNFMRVLGNEIIVYTKSQEKELIEKMPNKKIHSAPNSLFFKNDMIVNDTFEGINNIIYVGRLTKAKKGIQLVKAFYKSLKKIPNDSNLFIVGDGEEKSTIEEFIKEKKIIDRVKIFGHIGEYETLKSLYFKSIISVSPGYVGLSITQSFGFGVPMIISKDENHSPEIEAAIEGENAIFFKTDDLNSLSSEIEKVFLKKDYWLNNRSEININCKNSYSTEVMGQTFINLTI